MKNTLREAMLGPSVLLLALSAISTASSCKAAPVSPAPAIVPMTTPVAPVVAATEPGETVPATPAATDTAPASQAPQTPAMSPFTVQAKAVQTEPKAGETLDLVIEIKNTSDTQQVLHFTSGKRFDFLAFKAGDKEPVWTWSAGRMFTMMLRDQTVEPGATLVLKAKWPNPPQGKYTIRAKVTANGGLDAPPFEIEIK